MAEFRFRFWITLALCCACVVPPVCSVVPIEDFFSFGLEHGDSLVPAADDNFVGPISLKHPFEFFNVSHSTLFVNNNGAISFVEGVSQYTATCGALPQNLKMIAPFWADVNTGISLGGSVFYRETTDRELVQKAAKDIRAAYPDIWGLSIGWLFIVTWYDVPYHGANRCHLSATVPRNSFQAALASDGVRSFAIFYYNKIRWTTGTSSGGVACTGLGGQRAKVGFDVGDGKTFFEVPGSCTENIVNIDTSSNFAAPGKWIFRVDNKFESTTCDDEKYRNERLQISPSFVTVFGHVPITLKGPCLNSSMSVSCRFNDPAQESAHVEGMIQTTKDGTTSAVCTVPYLYTYGRIQVDMIVKHEDEYAVYSGFIYVTEPEEDVQVDISKTDNGKWYISLTWDPTYFVDSVGNLSLMLLEYQTPPRGWAERGVLGRGIPNSGSANLIAEPITVSSFVTFRLRSFKQRRSKRDLNEVVESVRNTVDGVIDSVHEAIDSVKGGSARLLCAEVLFTFDNDKACQTWYESDPGPPSDILSCPPLLDQAREDERFETDGAGGATLEYFHPGSEASFRQKTPSPSGGGQQCTYRDGKLYLGPPGGGTADAVAPSQSKFEHWRKDVVPWCQCCAYSDNEDSCRKYYEKRPSDPGDDYVPPRPARGSGDPHITTFDLATYTFNGVGEFWMIKMNNFAMQARMEQYIDPSGTPTPASVFTAFVIKDLTAIQVQLSQASGIDVLLDGELISFDDIPANRKVYTSTSAISASADRSKVTVSMMSGFSFSFTTAENSMNVMAMATDENKEKTRGLLGIFDGNPDNDLATPDGTLISPSASLEEIHDEFGMKWMITSDESLFTYPKGKTYDDYSKPNFKPNFVRPDIANLPQEVLDVCQDSMDCLYDYSTTGNANLANQTRQSEQIFNETILRAEALSEQIQMCSPVPRIDNGYVILTNLFVGSTVAFGCDKGYHLVGHRVAKCGNNTEWDREFPVCHGVGGGNTHYHVYSLVALLFSGAILNLIVT